ncbi:MAG: V-type ATP synthase subunit I [Eubacteriales bacterium]
MKKLSAVGLQKAREPLLHALMDLGVVELTAQDAHLADDHWKELVQRDSDEDATAKLEAKLQKVSTVLQALEQYDQSKKPLIFTRRIVSREEFDRQLERRVEMEQLVEQVNDLLNQWNDLRTQENRLHTTMQSLVPWKSLQVPLSMEGTRRTAVMLGVLPSAAEPQEVELQVSKITEKSQVQLVSSDAEQHYFMVLCLRQEQPAVLDGLKQLGFNTVHFKDIKGTAQQELDDCQVRLKQLNEQMDEIRRKISEISVHRHTLEFLHDQLVMERDQQKIRGRLLRTRSAFYLEGYLPNNCEQAVRQTLEQAGCWYEIVPVPKEEEAPVLLNNCGIVKPFEAITDMYSLPAYHGIDATPFFAAFYCIFFGMMLSDAAYGIVMAVGCFTVAKRFRLEGMFKKLVDMFFWCGISTTFWGILFGGWFGNIIQVIGQTFFGIQYPTDFTLAVWFDPVQQPMTLLIFSCILGVVHLFTGMAVKLYMEARDGNGLDAALDIVPWYCIILGLPLWAVGGATLSTVGMWLAIAGAVVLVLTGGRHNKGIMKVFGGVMSLYDITSYLSDILSYSRLLALGLATGVVATVINTMGSLMGGGIGGAIVLAVVFIGGHTFNFAINALGSFVHASRLQYVEFFGKFYEGGGEAFRPFRKNTKYVNITKEEQ